MDIETLIQELTKQQKTYSDRLRDRRANFDQNINPVYSERISSAMNEGVPISSSSVINAQNMFQNAADNYVNEPGQYLSDTQGQLMQLLGMQQSQKNADRAYELDVMQSLNNSGLQVGEDGTVVANPVIEGYVDQLRKGAINLNNVPAANRDAVVEYIQRSGINIGELEKEGEKNSVKRIIDDLQAEYYGSPGTEDDLSLGRGKNVLAWFKDIYPGDVQDGRYRNYRDLADGITSTLKDLVGENGVLTDRDNARIRKLLPETKNTPTEANRKWASVYKFIENRYAGMSTDEAYEQATQEPTQPEQSLPSGQDYVNNLWDNL